MDCLTYDQLLSYLMMFSVCSLQYDDNDVDLTMADFISINPAHHMQSAYNRLHSDPMGSSRIVHPGVPEQVAGRHLPPHQ